MGVAEKLATMPQRKRIRLAFLLGALAAACFILWTEDDD